MGERGQSDQSPIGYRPDLCVFILHGLFVALTRALLKSLFSIAGAVLMGSCIWSAIFCMLYWEILCKCVQKLLVWDVWRRGLLECWSFRRKHFLKFTSLFLFHSSR